MPRPDPDENDRRPRREGGASRGGAPRRAAPGGAGGRSGGGRTSGAGGRTDRARGGAADRGRSGRPAAGGGSAGRGGRSAGAPGGSASRGRTDRGAGNDRGSRGRDDQRRSDTERSSSRSPRSDRDEFGPAGRPSRPRHGDRDARFARSEGSRGATGSRGAAAGGRGRSSSGDRNRDQDRDRGRRREPQPEDRAPKGWGSLARRSLRELGPDAEPGVARQAWREAVTRARGDAEPEPWEPEVWVQEPDEVAPQPRPARGGVRASATGRKKRPDGGSSVRRRSLPKDVVNEVGEAVPPARADRYRERLAEAAKAYERDRYTDAAKILKPLADAMPGASAVRELYGLTMYRLGRWNDAIRELEAYRALEPGSYDQHPTLADAYRAKKRWSEVEALWEDLRGASPGGELVAEGRIVMAGALADQNKLAEAIALLEKTRTDNKRPRPHHLRIWYALADLYERAGEIPRARELFRRVFAADPELYDTADRLRSIG